MVLGFELAPESWFSAPANLVAMFLTDPELRARRQRNERRFWL
ncbi:hypothetical protein DFAR_1430017 [Desulfarculales bacterium]